MIKFSDETRCRLFLLAIGGISLFYLFVASHLPIYAAPWFAHDDALFFRGAEQILAGHWLGPYDNRTLIKGPFLSILGALSGEVGIHEKSAEALLYLSATLLVTYGVRRLGLGRCLALILFILMLSSPYIWGFSGRRFLRGGVYVTMILISSTSLTIAFLEWRKRRSIGLVFLAGLAAACGYLTREEDIWWISILAVLCFAAPLRVILRHRFRAIGPATPRTLFLVTTFTLGFIVAVGPVLYLNKIYYGRAIVTESRAPEFKAAVGSLMRVGALHPSGYVPVSAAAMNEVLSKIPVAAPLKPVWGQVAKNWEIYGKSVIPDYPNEIAGGWFIWALREAVAAAGYYSSATKAEDFYVKLSDAVNDACDRHILTCRARRDTLVPELSLSRIPTFLNASMRALAFTLRLSARPINVEKSVGTAAELRPWSRLIGPVVAGGETERRISGWIAYPGSDLAVAISGVPAVSYDKIAVQPGPDVVRAFAAKGIDDMHAIRFSVEPGCAGVSCALQISARGKADVVVDLKKVRPGPLTLAKPFSGFIDKVDRLSPTELHEQPLDGFLASVASLAAKLDQIIVPMFCVLSTLGLALYTVFARYRKAEYDWLVILAITDACAIFGRCAIVGLIDVTSWHAINTTYLGEAYPFVIMYGVLGTALLTKQLLQTYRPRLD